MHFLKKEFLIRGIKTNDIINGNTIMYCYVKDFKMTFLDSYRFIPMSLRLFPKTFGLKASKGYFPYRFFTQKRIAYVGPMPGLEWFDFDRLKEKDMLEALEWHAEHVNDTIDLYKMCMDYCIDDVKLLKAGCMKFVEIFMAITNNEIMAFNSVTIASVCMSIYKRFYLPKDTIAVLETRPADTGVFEWLEYEGIEYNPQQVGNLKIHGMSQDKSTVYIYHDCLDHGCKKCYNQFTIHPSLGIALHHLRYYYTTKPRVGVDYVIRDMWKCEWLKLKEIDPQVQYFLDYESREIPCLQIRDAFFGGHTEPTKLYYKCRGTERIRYFDYTSLYPTIQFGCHRGITSETYKDIVETPFPIGHPIRIEITDTTDVRDYFGFIKCKIQPPPDLYHPVLAEKKNGKLVFDLTLKIGTWTTVEVLKALDKGYIIMEIYDIVHFQRSSTTLFRDYVATFLKIKQEAAGWEKIGLSHASEEEKDAFIAAYYENQAVQLDKDKIDVYNPGLYNMAKLCLNSLWGKFGQRDNFTNTRDTFDELEFDEIIYNDRYEIESVLFHNNTTRSISYSTKNEFIGLPNRTNIAIAAYTTAYARLRLYEALETLGERVIYMDTDSVIFIDDSENPVDIVCGNYLGDLTSELESEDYIVEFVSTGPKSYGYRTKNGETCCKVKGFSLDTRTSQILNYDSMKAITQGRITNVVTQPLQFIISPYHSITTKDWGDAGKRFEMTFDKRYIDWDNSTEYCIDTFPFIV